MRTLLLCLGLIMAVCSATSASDAAPAVQNAPTPGQTKAATDAALPVPTPDLDILSLTSGDPSPEVLTRIKGLAHASMLDFADAIEKRSFDAFYSHVSEAWRRQVTQEKLERAFATFQENHVNLRGLRDRRPELEPLPQIDEHRLLVVKGYYPTAGFRVHFTLKYLRERADWKLFGIDVFLKKASTPLPATPDKAFPDANLPLTPGRRPGAGTPRPRVDPSEHEIQSLSTGKPNPEALRRIKTLAQTTMLDFTAAVSQRSFETFYDHISDAWRRQIKPEQLEHDFARFYEDNVDLFAVRGARPELDPLPRIDENHLLVVTGYYPAPIRRVHFTLKYFRERADWKLFAIAVDVEATPFPPPPKSP